MIPFTQLLPFQGNLKKRTEQDVENLAGSLLQDGMKAPFYIWKKPWPDELRQQSAATLEDEQKWFEDQPNYVLDGHGRIAAIHWIADHKDASVLADSYPYITIVEETLEEAKNTLLQVSSQYGKITQKGLAQFIVNCPKIDVSRLGVKFKVNEVQAKPVEQPKDEYVVMRLRVLRADVPNIVNVFKGIPSVQII